MIVMSSCPERVESRYPETRHSLTIKIHSCNENGNDAGPEPRQHIQRTFDRALADGAGGRRVRQQWSALEWRGWFGCYFRFSERSV